jgi:hypothetical protein
VSLAAQARKYGLGIIFATQTPKGIGRMGKGEFYFSTEATSRPIKIRTPLCLTWHPPNPLTAEEVVAKARGGRADL